MSSLQIWLAVIGALLVIALAAHGAWLARRASPRRAEADQQAVPDRGREPMSPSAPGEEREWPAQEPVLNLHGELDAHLNPMASDLEPYLSRRAVPRLDGVIDALAIIGVDHPVDGTMALAHMPTTRRVGSKSFLIEGQHVQTGEWETPRPGQRYGEFQAGVQMVNRLGAINALEYSEFVQKVQGFADGFGGEPDLPDMTEVLARARDLDVFASAHDAQLSVRLVAREVAWSPGFVVQQGARLGFVAGSVPGRLVLPASQEGAPPVLSLQFDGAASFVEDPNQAAVREALLSFDVPQTPQAEFPFAIWREAALVLGREMDAILTDDAGRPLQEAAFDAIGQELDTLYEALGQRDLPAGSGPARRLFT